MSALAALHSGFCLPGIDCGAESELSRSGDPRFSSGPPVVLRHDACGEIADPRLTCAHCGEQITAHNVTPEAGPGFRTDLAAEELA